MALKNLPYDIEMILGMDVIGSLGGVQIYRDGVVFSKETVCVLSDKCVAGASSTPDSVKIADIDFEAGDKCVTAHSSIPDSVNIVDEDFEAKFDTKWVVKWKWKSVPAVYGTRSLVTRWPKIFRHLLKPR